MIKEFEHYFAWTDAMKYEMGYAGLIGYQSKAINGTARMLWVLAPNITSEFVAEEYADNMLDQIRDINRFGKVIYSDGVTL